jgi:hypothetical protein
MSFKSLQAYYTSGENFGRFFSVLNEKRKELGTNFRTSTVMNFVLCMKCRAVSGIVCVSTLRNKGIGHSKNVHFLSKLYSFFFFILIGNQGCKIVIKTIYQNWENITNDNKLSPKRRLTLQICTSEQLSVFAPRAWPDYTPRGAKVRS